MAVALETGPILPETLEVDVYRTLWPDLHEMDENAIRWHYELYGRDEGRRSNTLESRADFIKLIPDEGGSLEIGPFCFPVLKGPDVSYFDVLDRDNLIARAGNVGFDPISVPVIDFVSPSGDLGIVDTTFRSVVSSHCLEHQPDLIGHLQQVERILAPRGRYFALVPDKRYCFDHFIPPSTVAGVIDAHVERRDRHRVQSVIEHRALTTHNDTVRHWCGDHGTPENDVTRRILEGLQEFKTAIGKYIDVHAWYFTPDSSMKLFPTLKSVGLIDLELERLYPTRRLSNEFWMVLRKP